MLIRIGKRVQLQLRAVSVQDTGCDVLALGEDRHRILNCDYSLNLRAEPADQLIGQAERAMWGLGSVVPRLSDHQLIWDVVVYDIDASPMVQPDTVERGLATLFMHLGELGLSRVAMEPIGMLHRGLSVDEFAGALHKACAQAATDLDILICHKNIAVIDRLVRLLALPH